MKKLILLSIIYCFFNVNVSAISLTRIPITQFIKLNEIICNDMNVATEIELSQTNKSFDPFTIEFSATLDNNIDKTIILEKIDEIFLKNNYIQYIDPSVKLAGIYLHNECPISCLINVEGDKLVVEFQMIDWVKWTYEKINQIARRLTQNSIVTEYCGDNGYREYIIKRNPDIIDDKYDIKEIITQIMEEDQITKQKGLWIKDDDEWIGEFENVPGKVIVTICIDKIIFSII
ncbi:MAG: hypothetical protein J1E97_03400 [Muribaculaceae bacterium]|nr:hypothetical protein [Muribaculaceae bacterium]